MKRLLLAAALLLGVNFASQAQIKIPGGADEVLKNFTAPPAIGDIGKTAGGIADILGSKLSLSGDQKKSTLDAVTGFLKDKQGIMGLVKSNPADYLKKFNPLQSGLFGKLKGIMGAAKFADFLKLKPTSNIAGNLLSNLFF
jgi:hypothetical protein